MALQSVKKGFFFIKILKLVKEWTDGRSPVYKMLMNKVLE